MQWGKGFDPRRGIHDRETHTETCLVCPGRGGFPINLDFGYEDCPLPCDLNGRKTNKQTNKKWSEWAGKSTLPEQESLTWVHGLTWESLTSKNSYSTHQIPQRVLDPQKNHHHHARQCTHAFYHLVCCSPQLSPICASFKHIHTLAQDTQAPSTLSLPVSQPHHVPDNRSCSKAQTGCMAQLLMLLFTDLVLLLLFMLLGRGKNP